MKKFQKKMTEKDELSIKLARIQGEYRRKQ